MLAIIKTGGKQYLVSPGSEIQIEKIDKEPGKEVFFDQVLLLEKNEKISVGTPLVSGAKVKAKILEQGREKKVIVFKYKAKKRYKKKQGHRQSYTKVEITEILGK
jgi:large subunit ribosomal protein L21